MAASIIGFKDPKADLRRKSPKIFILSLLCSILCMAFSLNREFTSERTLEATKKAPPVIIQIEDIPETRHVVRAPAPKLGMPLEVDDAVSYTHLRAHET